MSYVYGAEDMLKRLLVTDFIVTTTPCHAKTPRHEAHYTKPESSVQHDANEDGDVQRSLLTYSSHLYTCL